MSSLARVLKPPFVINDPFVLLVIVLGVVPLVKLARSEPLRYFTLLAVSLIFVASYGRVVALAVLLVWVGLVAQEAMRRVGTACNLPTFSDHLRRGVLVGLVAFLIVYKAPWLLGLPATGGTGSTSVTETLVVWSPISFLVFRAISFVNDTDRSRSAGRPPAAPLDVLLYLCWFPSFSLGPLTRFHEFTGRGLKSRWVADAAQFLRSLRLIAGGAILKFIADRFAPLAAAGLSASSNAEGFPVLFGLLAYALQLYFDFAGYSQMAIGISLLFGVELPQNFYHPYLARNSSEFWQRWHMSLSVWFRDYVYMPLSRRRVASARPWVNRDVDNDVITVFVMILIGLWHGLTMPFFVWGLGHGVWAVLSRRARLSLSRAHPALQKLINAAAVILLWIPFYSQSFGQMGSIITRALSGLWAPGLGAGRVVRLTGGLVAAILVLVIAPRLDALLERSPALAGAVCGVGLCLAFSVVDVVLGFLGYAVPQRPFLYFQF